MRVDAHHHLWRYDRPEYDWIDESMPSLQRNFLPADLNPLLESVDVRAAVAVQARQTLEETRWLLQLAAESPIPHGVVGWAPLADASIHALLDDLRRDPRLRGLRHVVQAEPDSFLDGSDFNRGICALQGTGLVYDLLLVARQLRQAIPFVDRHPTQTFVLDHLGKPDIAHNALNSWRKDMQQLALRDNVVCKLSGMVTEADWTLWTPGTLFPYFECALEAFGPSRLMVGSDWPVLTLACEYNEWWQTVGIWLKPLSESEQDLIRGGVATRVYHLDTLSRAGENLPESPSAHQCRPKMA